MANEEHLTILKQGVETWNQWRQQHPEIRPDLRRVDLVEASLVETDLRGANLREANLSRAELFRANLGRADLLEADLSGTGLSGANLYEANMYGARLNRADLSRTNMIGAILHSANLYFATLSGAALNRADLSEAYLRFATLNEAALNRADLSQADLNRASLSGTDLSEALLAYTLIGDVDLSYTRGLDTVRHKGPSTIGIDTIYKSQGQIPEVFLRGCGVPDSFIEYMRSLVGKPIDYYSAFISYSSKDQVFAERLYADLQAKGVRCWFAPHDLKIGDKFRDRIDESIRLHDKLLVILSEHSVESDWVEDEVTRALDKERQHPERTVLFPIRLDEAVMIARHAWASGIRLKRHIGDFTGWKDHDQYQQALARLLRDLQAPDVPLPEV